MKSRAIIHPILFVFSDWWAGISGGLSVPFLVLGLTNAFAQSSLFICLAFLALLSLAGRLAFRCIPKLDLACDPGIDGCGAIAHWPQTILKFWRLAVKTDCLESVRNCKGFLTRIEKDGIKKWGGESAQLTFAPGEDSDALSKTVYFNILAFLDVLAVTMRNEIFPGTKSRVWPYAVDLQSIFADAGKYLLTVAVAGDGSATITATLEFNWTRDWQTCDLRLAWVNQRRLGDYFVVGKPTDFQALKPPAMERTFL
jgi:hypothetical protein